MASMRCFTDKWARGVMRQPRPVLAGGMMTNPRPAELSSKRKMDLQQQQQQQHSGACTTRKEEPLLAISTLTRETHESKELVAIATSGTAGGVPKARSYIHIVVSIRLDLRGD